MGISSCQPSMEECASASRGMEKNKIALKAPRRRHIEIPLGRWSQNLRPGSELFFWLMKLVFPDSRIFSRFPACVVVLFIFVPFTASVLSSRQRLAQTTTNQPHFKSPRPKATHTDEKSKKKVWVNLDPSVNLGFCQVT